MLVKKSPIRSKSWKQSTFSGGRVSECVVPLKPSEVLRMALGQPTTQCALFRSLINQVTLLHLKSHFRDYPWSYSLILSFSWWKCIKKVRLSEQSKKNGFLNDNMLEKRLRHHMKMQKFPSGHTDLFWIGVISFNTYENTAVSHWCSLEFAIEFS